MKILSIDVGIKNLSYVMIEITSIRPKIEWKIIKWNNINVMHSFEDLVYVANEYTKWQKPLLHDCLNAFKIDFPENKMTKAELQVLIRNHLKSNGIKKTPSVDLQKLAINIKKHFDTVFEPTDYDAVVIENQPCMKNPQMKSMQMMVFTYFCLIPDITYSVRCIPASQKMRFCKSIGWIDAIPKGYANTKKTSVEIVSKLLNEDELPEAWKNAKKKDDLSDVILQAFAYCDKLV